jgi:signal transduction histidine kinase
LELADKVHRYEEGGFDLPAVRTSEPKDEVGILRRALERMASTIQSRTQEREKAYARTLRAERKTSESERLATLGQFSAGLAHELNNPLAVIMGSAQMAKDSKGVKLQSWLNEIHREANRCRQLVIDLLNFSKPVQLKIRRLDLADLIAETWEKVVLGRPNYQMKLSRSPFPVMGDPDRLRQVYLNLFKNAVEAMPDRGEVRVELKKNGNWIVVTVTDRGTGILKKNISKLFRPFFTTKAEGTGLGLVIVRSILLAHEGTLKVERGKPCGVKITLRWPQKAKNQRGSDGK